MNILYIGPYRLNTDYGYESLNILLSLQDVFPNVTSRAIYNESPINKLDDLNLLLSKIEDKTFRNFDLLIQHTSLNSMVYTTKIKQHIFIPMLDDSVNNYTQTQIAKQLQNYGLFLTRRDVDSFILSHSEITNKKSYKLIINNRLSAISNDIFNLGIYSSYKKYYTVTDSKNQDSIKQLIVNYISQIKDSSSCLLLFMQNVSQQILDSYNNYIKNVYQAMNINYSISKVVIIPIQLDNKSISAIHSSGDIYIDRDGDIHSLYASKYQKPVINNMSSLLAYYDYMSLSETARVCRAGHIDLSRITYSDNSNQSLTEIISNYV